MYLRSALACAAAAVLALGLPATAASTELRFKDHFDDGTMSPFWMVEKQGLWVENDWLHVQDPTPCCSTRDSLAVLNEDDLTWTDYTLELRMDPIPTRGAWPDELERMHVLFRVSHVTTFDIGYRLDGYRLTIFGPGDFEYPNGLVYLARHDADGTATPLFRDDDAGTSAGPMDVRVKLTGPRIQVWIDEAKVIDVVDVEPEPHLYGGIGLSCTWETHGRVDDVVVRTDVCAADLDDSGMVSFSDLLRILSDWGPCP